MHLPISQDKNEKFYPKFRFSKIKIPYIDEIFTTSSILWHIVMLTDYIVLFRIDDEFRFFYTVTPFIPTGLYLDWYLIFKNDQIIYNLSFVQQIDINKYIVIQK